MSYSYHHTLYSIYSIHVIFTGPSAVTTGFTNGVGQIWLDEVQCTGSETRLIDCPANPLGQHDCTNSQDAGVRCDSTVVSGCSGGSPQGAIRIMGGGNFGQLEICHANEWGTVCDDGWEDVDARVACVQLGLPSSSESNTKP